MKPDIDCENLYTNNSIYNRHFPTLRSYTTLTSAYGINTRHPFLKQNSLLPPDSSYRSKSKIIQAMTIAHRLHLSFEPSIFNFSFYLLAWNPHRRGTVKRCRYYHAPTAISIHYYPLQSRTNIPSYVWCVISARSFDRLRTASVDNNCTCLSTTNPS